MSVDKVAKSFNLPLSKLTLDYTAERKKGHILTNEEVKYLRHDVEIMARALDVMFNKGLTKITASACALSEYKSIITPKIFNQLFPLTEFDYEIRQSYKGGFTYLNDIFKGKEVKEGIVLDVNSLYPYVMYTKPLPFGEPLRFEGEYQKDNEYNLYVQCVSFIFDIKDNHIPCIQLKHNGLFCPTEYLKSSEGEEITMYVTSVDWELIKEQYDISDVTYHGGFKFKSAVGMFKDYIDKWKGIKEEATISENGGLRTLAKLMQNALYGKFGTNPRQGSKMPYLNEDGIVKYKLLDDTEREPVYIPLASFVTAWARDKTIRAAQSVYKRFIYGDTDSLHLIGLDEPTNLEIDAVKLGAWKHESTFARARFIRQKCYIEDELTPTSFYIPDKCLTGETKLKITCAGLPSKCYNDVTWDNYRQGAIYAGKLTPMHVKGGIVLTDTTFTIKG